MILLDWYSDSKKSKLRSTCIPRTDYNRLSIYFPFFFVHRFKYGIFFYVNNCFTRIFNIRIAEVAQK